MKKCIKCGIAIKSGLLCQTCAKYKRNGGVWHPLPPYGTVVYDEDGRPICHVCGMAMNKLIEHTKRKHGLDTQEYREKFGLMRKNARLTSPEYSEKMSDHANENNTWRQNFREIHEKKRPVGRRNPHWSPQEIELRREQQCEKGKKKRKRKEGEAKNT